MNYIQKINRKKMVISFFFFYIMFYLKFNFASTLYMINDYFSTSLYYNLIDIIISIFDLTILVSSFLLSFIMTLHITKRISHLWIFFIIQIFICNLSFFDKLPKGIIYIVACYIVIIPLSSFIVKFIVNRYWIFYIHLLMKRNPSFVETKKSNIQNIDYFFINMDNETLYYFSDTKDIYKKSSVKYLYKLNKSEIKKICFSHYYDEIIYEHKLENSLLYSYKEDEEVHNFERKVQTTDKLYISNKFRAQLESLDVEKEFINKY